MAQKLISFLTFEEVGKLIKSAPTKELKLAIALGAGSGLRISEVVGLKNQLSNCCNAHLYSKKIKREDNKKITKWFCEKCNNEIRRKVDTHFSPIKDDWAIPPLAREMVDLDAKTIRLVNAKGQKDRITTTNPWLNKTNIQILPINMPMRTLQYQFTAISKKVLKKEHNFHILRHSFGNYMVNEQNVPVPIVQSLMGHSRLDTTGIYTKANPQQAVKRAWEAF
jgi:integrase/recombinase XerD